MGTYVSRRLPRHLFLPPRGGDSAQEEKRAPAIDEGAEQADADVPGNGYTRHSRSIGFTTIPY